MLLRSGCTNGKAVATLTPEELCSLGLPMNYRTAICKLCKRSSTSKHEFLTVTVELEPWHPLLPWAKGTRIAPVGCICRVCFNVYTSGGFNIDYGTIDNYLVKTAEKPTLNHEFLECRSTFIKMKNDNPGRHRSRSRSPSLRVTTDGRTVVTLL